MSKQSPWKSIENIPAYTHVDVIESGKRYANVRFVSNQKRWEQHSATGDIIFARDFSPTHYMEIPDLPTDLSVDSQSTSNLTVSELIKECAKLGLNIDEHPDYPIQIHYADGIFSAIYEPNYGSIIECEASTPEEALRELRAELLDIPQNQE